MKKIFTLIAMAMAFMSASAQEVTDLLMFENGATYVDGDKVTSKNEKASVTFGNDGKAKWTVKATGYGSYPVLGYLGQTVTEKDSDTGEDKEVQRIITVVGGNNPQDASSTGLDFSGESGRLPAKGTYFIIKSEVAGTANVAIVVENKSVFIIDATNAEAITYTKSEKEYEGLQVASSAVLKQSDITVYGADGEALTTDTSKDSYLEDGDKGATVKISGTKVYGTIKFVVEEGHSYYILAAGSKLTLGGLSLTYSDTGTGITTIKSADMENAPAYNLAGQQVDASYKGVVIQNGKKLIQK